MQGSGSTITQGLIDSMKIETDFLVIGSGIAGLSFALNAANGLASNSLLEAVVFTEPAVQEASVYMTHIYLNR